jgi:hypothetical protein
MVVFAMHVVGNGTANRDELCARCHGQHPALGNHKALNVSQQNTGLTGQPASGNIKGHKAVKTLRGPQHPIGVEAHIAITSSIAKSQALTRSVFGQHLGIVQGL